MSRRRKEKIPENAKYPEIAKRIREKLGNIKNDELAKLLGLSPQVITKYTSGQGKFLSIEIEQFQKLCEILNITSDELLFGIKPQKNGKRFLKITYEIIKNDGVRQVLFTAIHTDEPPTFGEERRKKSEIYIDLP